MNIVYYGLNCFKIQGRDITLVTDSFSKECGLKPYFGSSDIVTISSASSFYNNVKDLKGEPFAVDSAGEYEIKKVVIRGVESEGGNIVYRIVLDNIRMCHLGALAQKSLNAEQLKQIGEIDILFIPVGGDDNSVLDSKSAENIISQIEPRIIIPMHYNLPGLVGELKDLETIESFCQKSGVECEESVSKFSIKKRDLPVEGARYIAMDLGK